MRKSIVLLTAVVTLVTGAAFEQNIAAQSSATPKPNDYLLVLSSPASRAGPYRFTESLLKGKPAAYTAAVTAFGAPSRAQEEFLDKEGQSAGFCHVTWAQVGVKLTVFAWAGSWPSDFVDEVALPRIRPCAAGKLATARFIGIELFGPKWHNRTGLQVGAPPPPGPRLRTLSVPEQVWAPDTSNHRVALRLWWSRLDSRGNVAAIKVLLMGYP